MGIECLSEGPRGGRRGWGGRARPGLRTGRGGAAAQGGSVAAPSEVGWGRRDGRRLGPEPGRQDNAGRSAGAGGLLRSRSRLGRAGGDGRERRQGCDTAQAAHATGWAAVDGFTRERCVPRGPVGPWGRLGDGKRGRS
jgi:hypothetical protein